jgi:hypothetical protein
MSEQQKKSGTPRWVWILLGVSGTIAVMCAGAVTVAAVGAAGAAKAVASADELMQQAEKKVATDAVAQYEIAQKSGDKIQICVQAGFVSAAYLQAKNEPKYLEWKGIEKTDCAAAGIPK